MFDSCQVVLKNDDIYKYKNSLHIKIFVKHEIFNVFLFILKNGLIKVYTSNK